MSDELRGCLLDTNVISELRKGRRCNARVAAWFEGLAEGDVHLSVLVIGEIRRGIERARATDEKQAHALDRWLRRVEVEHGERILPIDRAVAEEWGRMSAIGPLSTVDGLLAATAKVHGLTLATRNVKDVRRTGVSYVNPFDDA